MRRKIERYGLTEEIQPRQFFPTVEAAVDAWRAKTGATWADPPSDDPAAAVSLPQPRAGPAGTSSERGGGAGQRGGNSPP